MNKSIQNNKVYFENLDTLRFLAFFAVFASHSMLGTSILALSDNDFYKCIINFVMSGSVGVSFFFVLSGFLITYLIIKEVEQKNNSILSIFTYEEHYVFGHSSFSW